MGASKLSPMAGNKLAAPMAGNKLATSMAGNKLAAPRTQEKNSGAGFSSYNRNMQARRALPMPKQGQVMQDTQNQNTPMRRLEMPENREFAYNGPDPVYDQRRAKEVGPAYREAYMREIDKAARERN